MPYLQMVLEADLDPDPPVYPSVKSLKIVNKEGETSRVGQGEVVGKVKKRENPPELASHM